MLIDSPTSLFHFFESSRLTFLHAFSLQVSEDLEVSATVTGIQSYMNYVPLIFGTESSKVCFHTPSRWF